MLELEVVHLGEELRDVAVIHEMGPYVEAHHDQVADVVEGLEALTLEEEQLQDDGALEH